MSFQQVYKSKSNFVKKTVKKKPLQLLILLVFVYEIKRQNFTFFVL